MWSGKLPWPGRRADQRGHDLGCAARPGRATAGSRGDWHQAAGLERWLQDVESGFEDRILPVTIEVAAGWGRLRHAQPLPVTDALIAATARVHGVTVVTRNVDDFEPAGVQVFNPFIG